MAWGWLAVACVFEVMFALGAKAAHGFTRPVPSMITAIGAAGGVLTLGLALRELDLSIGYTVWTAVGAIGTTLGSAVIFGEHMSYRKLASILAIIVGVVGLRLSGPQ